MPVTEYSSAASCSSESSRRAASSAGRVPQAMTAAGVHLQRARVRVAGPCGWAGALCVRLKVHLARYYGLRFCMVRDTCASIASPASSFSILHLPAPWPRHQSSRRPPADSGQCGDDVAPGDGGDGELLSGGDQGGDAAMARGELRGERGRGSGRSLGREGRGLTGLHGAAVRRGLGKQQLYVGVRGCQRGQRVPRGAKGAEGHQKAEMGLAHTGHATCMSLSMICGMPNTVKQATCMCMSHLFRTLEALA